MQYALLPWPYLNSRYDASIRPVLMMELSKAFGLIKHQH